MVHTYPEIVTSVDLVLDLPVHITILDQNNVALNPVNGAGGSVATGVGSWLWSITPTPQGTDHFQGILVTPDATGFNIELIRTIAGIAQGDYTLQFTFQETPGGFPVVSVAGPALTLVVSQNTSISALQYQTP